VQLPAGLRGGILDRLARGLRTARDATPVTHGLSASLLDRLNEATKFADEWPINPELAKGYSVVATEIP